ncbi:MULTISPECIES: cytochrome c oxidase subunit II [Haloferax]|uniref:Ba3-type terminal oxidase subunit II n=2 Tax=Haloferax gibbonsii TaxID=35746 RepID=A0A0K1IRU6_HALGI|nr:MULTISPECIES: cytochrome c oxidase subunit II [Haloferax]AKU07038.1 cytochrome C oxidase subunit II [Haloferax gibbonsii]ELZ84893.1 ba3-type terminal oxidase subunit II [Haloferax gibbonsii ATCC 33959]QOS11093.1 ba3-type terminal oxidase subunit II [Haloferax gibbonsii]RDZ54893.1 cytochrome C oxidase subunit II [Haloferax sp. Atlit-4N]REA05466.1 cytochrome C oxidase subunit II [Haloferax sp. Atlit-6N]
MEIHAYEKLWLALALVLIVGFIGTITYGAAGAGIDMIDDKGGTVDPATLDQHPKFGDPGIERNGENSYDVYVVARQFVFEPGTTEPLRVPAGSTVTFHVTAADVIHGFEVVGTNANTMAIPGQVAEFTVEFGEPGEYGMLCNEYCGSGHHVMEGKIVVMEQEEFDSWYDQQQAQGEAEN